jgi:membrane-associated phospholipid phosphatase
MAFKQAIFIFTVCMLPPSAGWAQSVTDMVVLKGLSPVTVLSKTPEGTAALSANYTITGGLQTGAITHPTLLPFAQQQQQALQDVFITSGNLAQLADGLGTTLGAGYLARAHYTDRTHYSSIDQPIANVIAYAVATTGMHSGAGKFFFANATTDGKTPASPEAMAILRDMGGDTDIFGKSYHLPGGTPGADAYGNPRPFQTEPTVLAIQGRDYFNAPADNGVVNRGPLMTNSPSFPSGHTTYGYTGAIVLAVLVPARYQQMVTRAAEYGDDRILVSAHYAMDVIGGRTLALYDMAHLLANDSTYVGRTLQGTPSIKDFQASVRLAQADLTSALQATCGRKIDECSREDTGRLSNPAANAAFYAGTQTYNLPVVYPKNANTLEDVGKLAPEAGYLLTMAFPSLSLQQADDVLTETEGPGGGFLDDGSAFGIYSRLNLYAAAGRAAELAADPASGASRKNRPSDKTSHN